MTKTVRRVAVSALAASALLLTGGTAAIAGEGPQDLSFFVNCKDEGFASAGPFGADAGDKFHCINALAISD